MTDSNMPQGRTKPNVSRGIIPNHSFNGPVKWAYGVTDWFKPGLYFPVYTAYSEDRAGSLDGVKLTRAVGAAAHDRTCFYGVNFQFSVNY